MFQFGIRQAQKRDQSGFFVSLGCLLRFSIHFILNGSRFSSLLNSMWLRERFAFVFSNVYFVVCIVMLLAIYTVDTIVVSCHLSFVYETTRLSGPLFFSRVINVQIVLNSMLNYDVFTQMNELKYGSLCTLFFTLFYSFLGWNEKKECVA